MTQADIQLRSAEGELHAFLRRDALQPDRANVLVACAAFALKDDSNRVDAIALTEPIKTSFKWK